MRSLCVSQVINLGKPLKSFGTASLSIQWPRDSSLGKWLLYLMKINTRDLQLVTCSPEKEINPLRLTEVTHDSATVLAQPNNNRMGSPTSAVLSGVNQEKARA